MSEPTSQPETSSPTEDLQDLYENAPCGYLSLSRKGLIVKVNTTFCELTGHTKEQVLGLRLRDLLTVSGRMFYETHFAPLLRMQGFFNEVALDIVTADGRKLPLLVNARERRDANGDLTFTRVSLFVATDRRRFERELAAAKAAAEASTLELRERWTAEREIGELRDQFIAVLGHDLRNPLAGIDGAVAMLLREPQSEHTATVLRLIQGSTFRMTGLISNVLDFARGKLGGGLALNLQRQDVAPILLQVAEELRASVPDRTIELHISLDRPVTLDQARIAQMFSNLLGNAITHGEPSLPIHVSARIEDGELMLAVSNGGSAIPEAAMKRLFQPFYRGDVRPSLQGLGLGLFIASEIARAHGGRIEVTSDATETRFTFVMPADRSTATPPPTPPLPDAGHAG